MLSLTNVSKNFIDKSGNKISIIDNISFTVNDGEFLSILGPSGCGKTTLVNMLAKQETLSSGKISLSDNEIDQKISVVWQEDSLLPWLTVQKNIEYPLKIQGVSRNERKELAFEFVNKIGLKGFENYYPNRLSLGMKKRVALAAGLITKPLLLLMDEPFSALDVYTKRQIEDEVMNLWDEIKATIILVTHDVNEALALSDRIIVLSKRPAIIKTDINNDLPRPRIISKLFRENDFHNRVQMLWNELLDNENNEN